MESDGLVLHKAIGRKEAFEAIRDIIDRLSPTQLASVINFRDHHGHQPLHEAVIGGDVKVVQLLAQRGADLIGRKRGDWTALMVAAKRRDLGMVQTLLQLQTTHSPSPWPSVEEHDAVLELQNSDGFTAFHVACSEDGNDGCALAILESSARPEALARIRAHNHRSALFTAARHGNARTVKRIVQLLGIDIASAEEHGVTLRQNAEASGCADVLF